MRRVFSWISVGVFLAFFVVAVPSALALGGVTLRVWDSGGSPDDQADVYFDNSLLGRSDATSDGTTWDLGDLTVGSHPLKLIHKVDEFPPGTYSWELSGGGLSANDDTADVNSGDSVTIYVLANDTMTDVSAGATPTLYLPPGEDTYQTTIMVSNLLKISNVTDPSQGSVEISSDEKHVVYTADAGACGVDTFDYRAIDPGDPSRNDTATVTVTVEDTTPPVAEDDEAEVGDKGPTLINVLANDHDLCSPNLTIVSVTEPVRGSAEIIGDEIGYTPIYGFIGRDEFSYIVKDACGNTSTAGVQVTVYHVNQPPRADAGLWYRGYVGESITLDAGFSIDPDIEDRLQYRWELGGNSRFDTDWLDRPTFEHTWDRPYRGLITVEVRDLYRGVPTGSTDQATAMASIILRPPRITVSVFFDENADGSRDEDELGMPDLAVLLETKVTRMTLADGTVTFTDLDPGSHTIIIPQEGIQAIEGRGYGLKEMSQTVGVEPGESAILFFALQKVIGKVKGSVFLDENGNGTYEEGEPTVALVTVQLDGGSRVTTDESGQFLFLYVQPGEHALLVSDESGRSMTISFVLGPGEELVLPVAWAKVPGGFMKVQIGED